MSENIVKNSKIIRILLFLLILLLIVLSPLGIMQVNADTVMTTVSVGNLPQRVAVNEATNRIYITSGDIDMYPSPIAGKVTIIDGTNYSVLDTLDVGNTPKGMAVDGTHNKIYVANMRSNGIMVIDGNTNAVSTLAEYINRPIAVAVNVTTGALYVAQNINDGGYGYVKVLNSSTGVETTTLTVEKNPSALVLNDRTNKIYVTHENSSGTVTVIDGSSNITVAALSVGSYPESIAVNEETNKIYVANSWSDSISVIDGDSNTVIKTVAVGGSPWGVAVNASTNRIYVANQTCRSVSVIDGITNTVVQTIEIPDSQSGPIAVAVDQTRNKIYVSSIGTNKLTVIDGSVIEAAGITGLTAPAAGETPEAAAGLTTGDNRCTVSTLSWQNLNGTPATLDGSGNFANAGNTYKAEIVLTAGSNYKFPAGLKPAVNTGSPTTGAISGDTPGNTLTFEVTFPADISTASLSGMVAPAAGETPEVVSALTSGNSAQYAVTSLTWEGPPLTAGNKFASGGTSYQARIVLTSQPGYKFPAGGLTPCVDGDGTAAAGTVGGGDVTGNTLTFVVTFSVEINNVYITNLNPPAVGETPQAAGDLSFWYPEQYSVSDLTWQNSNGSVATLSGGKFVSGGSTYKAVIQLTSLEGYKFPPASITPMVDYDGTFVSGVVSGGNVSGNKFTFEITFSNEITAAAITGMAAPVKGAVPITYDDLTSGNSAQYSVDYLYWADSDGGSATLTDGKFNAGSIYKAMIYLESNTGYKFPMSGLTPTVDAGTPAAGEGSSYASGNTYWFEVIFPATASDTEYTAVSSIIGVPTTGTVGSEIDLTDATVSPSDATNKMIAWTVKDAGTTGVTDADLLTGKFTPVSAGTLELTATVTNGLTESTDFKHDFAIEVSTTPATTYTITASAGSGGNISINFNDHLYSVENDTQIFTIYEVEDDTRAFTFTITPASGHAISLVLIDGVNNTAAVNSGSYTFTDVQANHTIYASFASTSNGNGGSHGSGTTSPSSEEPKLNTSNGSTTATTKATTTTDSSGKATASVTKDQLSEAVNSAVTEAQKQGDGTSAIVEIKVEAPSNTKTVETSIPKAAVKLAADGGTDALRVSTPVASISFDTHALTSIYDRASGDVKITTAKVDASSLSAEVQTLIGNRPVYNFSVTSGNDTISEFDGKVTVSVPYTPAAGEDTDAIVIYFINSDGEPEAVFNCKYDPETKTVSFTTNHFSAYAVGYNKVSFNDVKDGAWYENAVQFAAARGIVTGTGNGNFDPNGKLTRGQLLVMLMRSYGIKPDMDLSGNFSDAGNTYYTGYLAAAKRLGITEGLGNNLYAPDSNITRQEMFTLLYNTLKAIGELPEGTEATSGSIAEYNDADSVASWAKDAAGVLADAGVISGNNGELSPLNTTSRAEMAQVLYNLLSK